MPGDEDLSLEAARVALELGADVNAANKARGTAMHGAATKGYNQII
jgi:hypothetical protein